MKHFCVMSKKTLNTSQAVVTKNLVQTKIKCFKSKHN